MNRESSFLLSDPLVLTRLRYDSWRLGTLFLRPLGRN